jgi:HD-like signal output (HDOD) protein
MAHTLLWVGSERSKPEHIARIAKRLPAWSCTTVATHDEAKATWPTDGVTVAVSEPANGTDAGFLDWVRERSPATGRLLVVSDPRRTAALAATTSAQQVMLATASDEVLAAAISRMSMLRELTANPAIVRVVGNLDRLPSVPRVYTQLTRATESSTAGAADIARIIETDPGMSLKVLQLANSAFFGLTRRMTSIRGAVIVLGLEVLKALVLSSHVISAIGKPSRDFSIERFQAYSLRIARIVRRFLPDRADDAFAAGLLHDIGRMIIGLRLPQESVRIAELAAATEQPIHEIEREFLGITHGAIGAFLLALWGVPFGVVEAVAFHSEPSAVKDGDRALIVAVHAAEALHDIQTQGASDDRLDMAAIESANFTRMLPVWRSIVAAEAASMS